MKFRLLSTFLVGAAMVGAALAGPELTAVARAQNPGSAPQAGQNGGQANGGGYGQRGGRGGFGGGMGRGLMGTVTEVAADHYTIKTESGDTYAVHFDANTRITKQPAGMRGPGSGPGGGPGAGGQGAGAGGGGGRMGGGGGYGGNPPQQIKATDIKVGDMINATGETDATAKTVAAMRIMQLDPETVKRIKEMEANFGKTWLEGKVTAIDGVKIAITGALDHTSHTILADENTTFRKRRDPVTLADIQVGDTVRADGAVKDGVFTATSVNVEGGMAGGGPANPPGAMPASPAAGAPPQ
jgi:Domain of unknown function (DUF5666)